MPDPRILKSGDGWRVVEEGDTAYVEYNDRGCWFPFATPHSARSEVVVFNRWNVFTADLPRIAAALTALHEVLQERTTSTTNSQE